MRNNYEEEKRRLEEEYNRLTEEEKSLENLEFEEDSEESPEKSSEENAEENAEEKENGSEESSENEEEDSTEEDNEEDSKEKDYDEEQDGEEREKDNDDGRGYNEEDFKPRDRIEPKVKEQIKEDTPKSSEDKINDVVMDKVAEKSKFAAKALKVKRAAAATAAAAKNAVAGITLFGQFLLNPLFWIFVIAVVIIIAIMAGSSIMGGNDYNKLCDSNGVGQVLIEDDSDHFTRQSAIASWLMSTPFEIMGGQPFTREQAMGIMGNFLQESGGTNGANPKYIQGDYGVTRWQTCDNDCVGAFVGGGQAVGILQWDGHAGDRRRDNLVKLARSEGKQWYDLNVQLKHLKMEIDAEGDHTYENHMLKKSGFLTPGKSVEEYTKIWMKAVERCGRCAEEKRVAFALEFDSKYQGGGGSSSLSTQCIGSVGAGSVDVSSLQALAKSIAYTREEKKAKLGYGKCSGEKNCGQDFSKEEYKQAKIMAEEYGVDPLGGLLASCDRLVATMVRTTGIDTNFPWGNALSQMQYMQASPNWKRVSCQERQPGDVFGKKGHIMIYVGDIDGKETVVSASYKHRSAHMSNIKCDGDLFYGDAMAVPGYRKVN